MTMGYLLLVELLVLAVFLAGIGRFRTPRAARLGNWGVAFAVLAAIVVSVGQRTLNAQWLVTCALACGVSAGWGVARSVTMTQIPALVGFQNGAGGIASACVSLVVLTRQAQTPAGVVDFAAVLGLVVGTATFSGSLVAAGKLARIIRQSPICLPKHDWILAAAMAVIVGMSAVLLTAGRADAYLWSGSLFLVGGLLGILVAIRVGGADMPVMISWFNALSGVATAFCGVVVQNRMVIACGATVAASGLILTHTMCRAMHRHLWAVLVGGSRRGPESAAGTLQMMEPEAGTAEPAPPAAPPEAPSGPAPLSRATEAMRTARKIIIVPGYGMALAHAQCDVVALANRLSRMNKDVKFAIHPIAGRMPGHMHVLLAEAEADFDMLFDLPDINDAFPATDLVVIVGACDVVNPAAIALEGTPISGMPILAAHEAGQVVVCNLDDRPGYSGVPNPLYTGARTILLLGDAHETLRAVLQALD